MLALRSLGDTIRLTLTITWDDITRVQKSPPGTAETPTCRDQAYLIVLAGSAMGEMFKISSKQTIIGRGQTAQVRMMDEGISREHCEIQIEGETMILHDLGSTNGTFCRGARVDRHVLIIVVTAKRVGRRHSATGPIMRYRKTPFSRLAREVSGMSGGLIRPGTRNAP